MTYTIEVFYNTGFNQTNIPSSINVLYNNFTPKSFADCVFKQSKILASVRIATTYQNIDGADYLVVGAERVCYFITNINMLNEQCAELSLVLDGITTVGLNNIQIVTGWCKRKHVTDDTLMSNILPEPFTPSNELTLESSGVLKPNPVPDYEDLYLIGASFNLGSNDFYEARKYVVDGGSDSVICPQVPTVPNNKASTIDFNVSGVLSGHYVLPSTYLFDARDLLIQENLSAVRALGLDNGLTASYIIPKNYYLIKTTDIDISSMIYEISNNYGDLDTNISYKFEIPDYTPLNNKVYALWNIFTIMSTCSGSRSQFKASEIYDPSKPNFNVTFFADLAPNGKPYFAPSVYHGSRNNTLELAITGMPWQNQPIAYDRKSGTDFDVVERQINLNEFATRQMGVDLNETYNGVDTIVSALSSVASGLGSDTYSGASNIATGAAKAGWSYTKNEANIQMSQQYLDSAKQRANLVYNMNQNYVVPEITFPRDESIQNYLGNYVLVTRNRLSNTDVHRFDTFLNMYGYAVDEPLTISDFKSRKLYNYVLAQDVTIKTTTNVPMYVRDYVERQMNNGIRVWHVAPDRTLFETRNEVV